MAGFSQTLQSATPTTSPTNTGAGAELPFQAAATVLDFTKKAIGSSYAESQVEGQVAGVIADFQRASGSIQPMLDQQNKLSAAYAQNKDPKLLVQLTGLSDTIRQIQLGESSGKLSALSAKARIESAYKTAIHRFPKFAQELRMHKDQVTSGGVVGTILEQSDRTRKLAVKMTEKLANDMALEGKDINSKVDRVQFVAERRWRADRDNKLKDIKAGQDAYKTPLEFADEMDKLRGEKARRDLKDKQAAQTYAIAKLGYSEKMTTSEARIAKILADSKKAALGLYKSQMTLKYDITKSKATSESAVLNAEITRKYGDDKARLSNDYTVARINSSKQGFAHREITNPLSERSAQRKENKDRRSDAQDSFAVANGGVILAKFNERIAESVAAINSSQGNPAQKAARLRLMAQTFIDEANATFSAGSGRNAPSALITSMNNIIKNHSDMIIQDDPNKSLQYKKDNQKLKEYFAGGENDAAYHEMIGDASFRALGVGIINLKAKLAGATGQDKLQLEGELAEKLRTTGLLSRPFKDLMVEYDLVSSGSISTDRAAVMSAIIMSGYDKKKASADPALAEAADKALSVALKNDTYRIDIMSGVKAGNIARSSAKNMAMFRRSYELSLNKAAQTLGGDLSIQYLPGSKGWGIMAPGDKEGTSKLITTINFRNQGFFSSPFDNLGITSDDVKKLEALGVNILGLSERLSDLDAVRHSPNADIVEVFDNVSTQYKKSEKFIQNGFDGAVRALTRPVGSSDKEGDLLSFKDTKLKGAMNGWNPKLNKTWEKVQSKYQPIIQREIAKGDPAITEELVIRLMGAESEYKETAKSTFKRKNGKVGHAYGLMQLTKSTAKELGVKDVKNVEQNIAGGIKYLNQLYKRFGDIRLVVAAYNAGPTAVAKHKGVPPYKETQQYVKKIFGEK